MHRIRCLDFDTKIFNFAVAKILPSHLGVDELGELLRKLQERGVKLVYWQAAHEERNYQAAAEYQGFLASEQMIYRQDLSNGIKPDLAITPEIYTAEATDALEQLAYQIGERSRFGRDPQITTNKMHVVYREWLKNSLTRTVADQFWIIRANAAEVGFITAKIADKNCLEIGLVAVAENYRGCGYGKALVQTALNWGYTQGCTTTQVVTQKTNLNATHLYTHCGFTLARVDTFFHFWL